MLSSKSILIFGLILVAGLLLVLSGEQKFEVKQISKEIKLIEHKTSK